MIRLQPAICVPIFTLLITENQNTILAMKTAKHLLSIAAATIILISCKKEYSGPAGVKFQLKATNNITAVAKTTAASITWTSGTATPSLVKFEAKKGTTEVEFSSTAGQQVNLFSVTQSTFGNITLPDGNYSEIELKINVNGTTASPALELNGTYNNGTVDIPVLFQVTTPLIIKAEKNNVDIAGGSFTAVTELDLSLYTTGITQAMLNSTVKTGGTIVISSTSNANLYNIVVNNIDRFHHAEFNHG